MPEDARDLHAQTEPTESMQSINSGIAERIDGILAPVKPQYEGFKKLRLIRRSNNNYKINLGRTELRELDGHGTTIHLIPAELPETFALPTLELSSDRRGNITDRETQTSEYGVLDEYFLGADGKLYVARNTYIFNREGQAMKCEAVTRLSYVTDPGKHLRNIGIDPNDVKRLDFIPDSQVRMAELQPGDYEKVEGILDQIDSGEFEEVK